ncbi:MAG: class I SAM-dependent methyltransferase [bacterium]
MKKRLVNALLARIGLELRRTAASEERPWDHIFRGGIAAEVTTGGDANAVVESAWGTPGWEKYITAHVTEGMVVCEIGPGVGRWTRLVLDAASKLYLVDYSKLVCDYWRKKNDGRLIVIQSANTRIPDVPSASVDLFMSFDVFVHMDVEVVFGYLQEAYRVLKPSGVALIDYLSLDDRRSAQWFIDELRKQGSFDAPDEVKRSIFRMHHHETIQVLAETIGFEFSNVKDAWWMHNICTLRKR